MKKWNYKEAFKRNLGLISPEEQDKLRNSRVAIAGMGGVGGVHAITLARLGIGRFTLADPDFFEVANFNRQAGAKVSTVGKSKVMVMKKEILDINPNADVRALKEPVTKKNVKKFLADADLFIDGIDAFVIDARRVVYHEAARKGIFAVSAGPLGFGTGYIGFDPNGISFDRYFDFRDDMDSTQKFAAFILGVAPKAIHRSYSDYSLVNVHDHVGPSASLACMLCAGVVGADAVKILLGRGPLRMAPHYCQFDAYFNRLVHGYLWGGNRHPLQRLKRFLLERYLRRLGL
jgi:hypothetical protein